LLSIVFPLLAGLVTAAGTWLKIGAGDVLKVRREEDAAPERPSRQSWVLITRVPSAQTIEVVSEATETTGDMVEERLVRLAGKFVIVDGPDDMDNADDLWNVRTNFSISLRQLGCSKTYNMVLVPTLDINEATGGIAFPV
jgi:hypothetical protein